VNVDPCITSSKVSRMECPRRAMVIYGLREAVRGIERSPQDDPSGEVQEGGGFDGCW
jgi:hypothetical protein